MKHKFKKTDLVKLTQDMVRTETLHLSEDTSCLSEIDYISKMLFPYKKTKSYDYPGPKGTTRKIEWGVSFNNQVIFEKNTPAIILKQFLNPCGTYGKNPPILYMIFVGADIYYINEKYIIEQGK